MQVAFVCIPILPHGLCSTMSYVISITARYVGDLWIGLNDIETEGSPVWSDGTTTFTSGIQDDDDSIIDRDCVYMNTASEWHYGLCLSWKVVICQGKYNAMQCNAIQCNAMQCNAMQCNAMQYNAYNMILTG